MKAEAFTIEKKSLAEQVYDYVKKMILSGELKGGEHVPERKIAEQLGISRTPIREALRRLDEYGLVKVKPRSYAEVVALQPDEFQEVALIRAQLESLVVHLLITRLEEQDLVEFEELMRECNQALAEGDVAKCFEIDSQFHLQLAQKTGNQNLYEILQRLDVKVQLWRLSLCINSGTIANDIAQHQDIIDALQTRDETKAMAAMKHHILHHIKHLDG